MTRGRKVAAGLGLVLSAIVMLVWVIPIVSGPTVECVDVDLATCDETWRIADGNGRLPGRGIEGIFPVTAVRVSNWPCPQFDIERLYGLLAKHIPPGLC